MACDDSGIRRLILASGSPRRRQLLSLLGLPFVIKAAGVDERQLDGEDPSDLVLRVSQAKALAIADGGGDRPRLAITYHQLGMVAQDRGDLTSAEDWYRKSLAIEEELGDRPGMASTYHQLGIVAQLRGHLKSAEDWCRKSLAIKEEVGNRPGMAISYGQLGLLAERRGEVKEALKWTMRCVGLFDEFPHPSTGPGPVHLARLTADLGMEALEAAWQECTGKPLPDTIRQFVTTAIEQELWKQEEEQQ